jgi:hypothetical protein
MNISFDAQNLATWKLTEAFLTAQLCINAVLAKHLTITLSCSRYKLLESESGDKI